MGSFTAEQLLVLMQIFNVSLDQIVPSTTRTDPHAELQNALARLGAAHLRESENVLPSETLADVHRVVREALLLGDPRLITALAPVLVNQSRRLSLPKLEVELRELGMERRLAWLVDNILAATALRPPPDRAASKRYRRAELDLMQYLTARLSTRPGNQQPYDILDPTVRTKRTLDDMIARASPMSKRWRIATELKPADFARALEAAHAGDQ